MNPLALLALAFGLVFLGGLWLGRSTHRMAVTWNGVNADVARDLPPRRPADYTIHVLVTNIGNVTLETRADGGLGVVFSVVGVAEIDPGEAASLRRFLALSAPERT